MRHALAVLATAVALLVVASPAFADPPQAPPSGRLVVSVKIDRFAAKGARASAQGTATAILTGVSGQTTSIKQKVTLTAAAGSSCKVLHLFLQQLDLQLLGLNAHLDKVQLDITGKRSGGVLGSCSASSRRASAAARCARPTRSSRRTRRGPCTSRRASPSSRPRRARPRARSWTSSSGR
ncbi:MAG: hypothetical protein QOJ82_963 [Solirubrobacteraceae bacterium]|nr:hypothetical protein [Solirubrobacteraceae bacterium]